MDLIIKNGNTAFWGSAKLACAVGRGGILAANKKQEGDGATPAGTLANASSILPR